MVVSLQGYDLTGITEMWCDSSYNWNATLDTESLRRACQESKEAYLSCM